MTQSLLIDDQIQMVRFDDFFSSGYKKNGTKMYFTTLTQLQEMILINKSVECHIDLLEL